MSAPRDIYEYSPPVHSADGRVVWLDGANFTAAALLGNRDLQRRFDALRQQYAATSGRGSAGGAPRHKTPAVDGRSSRVAGEPQALARRAKSIPATESTAGPCVVGRSA